MDLLLEAIAAHHLLEEKEKKEELEGVTERIRDWVYGK